MANNEQNIDRFNNPQTAGEREQVKKIQKFHPDTNVIGDVREKLKSLKEELVEDKKSLDNQISRLERRKDIPLPKERAYDTLQFDKKIKTLFMQLLSFRKTKTNFIRKYGHNRKITWKFFNFLLDKSIFYPERSVYFFAKHITSVQQELRIHYRKMFRSGWLNHKGEEVLTQHEFNLIGEMERLVHDNSIINFMIYYKQPAQAIKKVSSFLGYYFSVTRNTKTIDTLLAASRKSLTDIVYPDSENDTKVPMIIKKITAFLSQNVDFEFLIPFFESAFLEPLNSEALRSLVTLNDIEEKKYKADKNLLLLMTNRKSTHTDEINKKVIQLEEELDAIQQINEIINKKIQNRTIEMLFKNTSSIPYLDYVLLINTNYDADDFTAKRYNLAAYLCDMIDFFDKTYESFFTEGINIKSGQGITATKIFEPQIFIEEIGIIKKEKKALTEFISDGFRFDFLNEHAANKKSELFSASLNNCIDAFYGIAEKLMTITKGHNKMLIERNEFSNMPVPFKHYNHSLIPYYEEKIVKLHSTETNPFTLKNKKVKEAFNDIITFSYCLVARFEHKKRDYAKSWRHESLYDKTNKAGALMQKLEELHESKTPVE